jgi:hypothetical protein
MCRLPASGVPTLFQHLVNAASVHVITRCNSVLELTIPMPNSDVYCVGKSQVMTWSGLAHWHISFARFAATLDCHVV